ncbi:MAG: tetratricopeptide repeat protein [Verrucomicrobiia bacterium]
MHLIFNGFIKLSGIICFFFALNLYGSELVEPTISSNAKQFYYYFHSRYEKVKTEYDSAITNSNLALRFAKACFEFAEFATNSSQRAYLAEQGIVAAKSVLEKEPQNGEAHYWLAMSLAQLARTKGWGALKIVNEMEKEYLKAIELNPEIDYAGPHRLLGLLYRDAPGWPISVGSKHKAKYHLQQAVKLAPNFPDNQLFLIESYIKWGEKSEAIKQLKEAKPLIENARGVFTGEYWSASWTDWNSRLKKILDKLKID